MEGKLLVEKKRAVVIESEVVTDDFKYNVTQESENADLLKLTCSVFKENDFHGYMSYDVSEKKISSNFPENEEINIHYDVFKKIITEVKESLQE